MPRHEKMDKTARQRARQDLGKPPFPRAQQSNTKSHRHLLLLPLCVARRQPIASKSLINSSYQIRSQVMGCSISQPGSIKPPPLSISVLCFGFVFG